MIDNDLDFGLWLRREQLFNSRDIEECLDLDWPGNCLELRALGFFAGRSWRDTLIAWLWGTP